MCIDDIVLSVRARLRLITGPYRILCPLSGRLGDSDCRPDSSRGSPYNCRICPEHDTSGVYRLQDDQ
jgi:hypothetical protein